MSRSPVIWISKSEPYFKRLALFILSGLWGSVAGTKPCSTAWKERARLPLPGTLSLNLFQAFKKVSQGCRPEPVSNSALLESQKNKIPTLGPEGRERGKFQTLYKLQNTLSSQTAAAFRSKRTGPCALGRSLGLCCGLWAPPVGTWLLIWGLKELLFFVGQERSGWCSLICLGCRVVCLSEVSCTRWFRLPTSGIFVLLPCSETKGKQQQLCGVFWVWIRVYCTVGWGGWAGGDTELHASVAHSHPLPMTPKKGTQLTLGL